MNVLQLQGISVQITGRFWVQGPDVKFVDPWEQNMRCLRSWKKMFRGNIQFVRVKERSKVHLRGGDDGTVYHLTPTCGSKKWMESGGRSESNKMVQTTNGRKEKTLVWVRETERGGGGGGKEGREEGGKDTLKEQGERFSLLPLPALRLSLAVLIYGFSAL